ncbi:MAG: hypothetical protein CL844_03490, partial [Crocinitomicaceae bacterium]|nr:hypothetical protein [Crocinitomicaceae bacterium]
RARVPVALVRRRRERGVALPAHALRGAPLPHRDVGERALLRRDAACGAVGQPDARAWPADGAARARGRGRGADGHVDRRRRPAAVRARAAAALHVAPYARALPGGEQGLCAGPEALHGAAHEPRAHGPVRGHTQAGRGDGRDHGGLVSALGDSARARGVRV